MQLFMNQFFSYFKTDKVLVSGYSLSCIFLIATTVSIIIAFAHLPPFIPLFNQMQWGEMRLGSKEQISIPLLTAFSIYILNFFFSIALYKQMPLVSRILCITSLLVCLFTLLFVIRTIQLAF